MKRLSLVVLVCVLCVGVSQAISWSTPQDVVDASDVITTGDFVIAANAAGTLIADSGYPTDPVVNGVTFAHTTDLLDQDHSSSDFYPGGAGDAYDGLLSTLDYSKNPATVALGGGLLEIGKTYQIQIWYVDARGNYDARGMSYGGSDYVYATGQFVVGTFEADATSVDISIIGNEEEDGGTNDAHLNAYQIREVPEPATMALLGLGSLVSLRRRKK